MSVKTFTPNVDPGQPVRVFLAGSIENGVAANWQEEVIQCLHDHLALTDVDVEIYNPRRGDWDSSIDSKSTDPTLRHQILWELDALERADVIMMFFDPSTKSPISLLELGLHKHSNMFVCCPSGFWRSTNVLITSEYYNIPHYQMFDQWIDAAVSSIHAIHDELKNPNT